MKETASQPFSPLEEIKRLTAKIAELRGIQLQELKERRNAVLAELRSIDKEIAKLIEAPELPVTAAATAKPQRRRISDGELKALIVKALAEHGANGLSVPEIATHVGHDAQRIRKFVSLNPRALKKQGAGRGTRYFLP